ncbi:MAG: sulfotransferase [Phycisphaerales bacterium]|jgi:tetratricopeptide (TPR) repeat protein|nr:sulfotransferase [Phycisphaerales bacterium]
MSQAANLLQKARSLAATGQFESACQAYFSAAQAEPGNITIWTELGAAFNAANRPADALQALARAGKLNPQHVPALVEASRAEVKLGRFKHAAAALQRATTIEPGNAVLWREFAIALHRGNAGPQSLGVIQRAHELAPDDHETTLTLGMMLADNGAVDTALPHLQRAAAQNPGARQYAALANCLSSLSRMEEAREAVEKAAAINPRFPGVPFTRARIAESLGRLDEAVRIAEDAIRDGSAAPDLLQKYASLMRANPQRGNAIDLLRQALHGPRLGSTEAKGHVLQGLGTLLDAEGRFAEAFDCFKEGNALIAPPFSAQSVRNRTESLRRAFSRDAMAALPKGDPSERRPSFIVGMPRSGTTLLERIIDAHPEAKGVSELETIPRLFASLPSRLGVQGTPPDALRFLTPRWVAEIAGEYTAKLRTLAPDAARVIDKLPHNFLQLGFISVLFPGAAILHSSRHPLDTCVSCFMTPLSRAHAYRFTLAGLVVEYTEYRKMMEHWKDVMGDRITDIKYEDVVADLNTEAHRVIDALGLAWNDACLAFHKSAGPVVTASVQQVRRPIYDSSTNRWKNYEPYIGELIEGLRQFL